MSDLGSFSKALDLQAQRKQQERAELNQKLGEPVKFIADPDNPQFGIGYWKVDNGVISYRRYANGYDPYSRVEYPNEFIDLLVQVRGR